MSYLPDPTTSIDQNTLNELVNFSSDEVEVILKKECDSDEYLVFIKNAGDVRQVHTQRDTPRSFKDLTRACSWGKSLGVKTTVLEADLIDQTSLSELLRITENHIDLVIEYNSGDGQFYAYSKCGIKLRQVCTQRHTPKKFRDLERMLMWGKTVGFRSVVLKMTYTKFLKT